MLKKSDKSQFPEKIFSTVHWYEDSDDPRGFSPSITAGENMGCILTDDESYVAEYRLVKVNKVKVVIGEEVPQSGNANQ